MERPKVGVGVIIKNNGKVLLGRRIFSHGTGTWIFPGGHLEFNEKVEDCAAREALEECGLKIKDAKIGPYTNDFFEEGKHYITLYVIAESFEGTPKVMEPNKTVEWQWFSWDKLPSPLFLPVQNLLKQGFNPFKQ